MITTNYNTNTIKPRFATNIPELLNLQQTSLNSPIVQVSGPVTTKAIPFVLLELSCCDFSKSAVYPACNLYSF